MNTRQLITFLALTLIWGSSFLWIKLAVQQVSPFTIVAIRLLLALVILLPFLIAARAKFPRGSRLWCQLLLQGLMSTAIPWLLITWAEKHIDSAVATVLNGTVPLFTIVTANRFIHDDRMTRRRLSGLLVGFAGVVVLMMRGIHSYSMGGEEAHWVVLGQLAMLGSSFFYAISNVYGRAKFRNHPPVFQAFYTMLMADAVMWIVTPVVDAPFTIPTSGIAWLALMWLGMLGAGISYLMFYHLLHSIGPTRVALVTYTIPVVGVSMGVIFLNEALTWQLIVGTVLIVSGVWSANVRARGSGRGQT